MYRWSNYLKLPLAGILALSATRPVFTADLYVIDGGSGKTRALADWNDNAHWLDQANTTLQCALPAAHADFNNQLCLTFDHTAPNWYVSNAATSRWKFLTDSGGSHAVLTLAPTVIQAQYFASLLSGSPYLSLMAGGATTTLRCLVTNDAGGTVFDLNSLLALAADTSAYHQWSYLEGSATPEAVLRKGGTIGASADSSAAPGSNNPTVTMNLGRRPNGTFHASMRWREFMCFPHLGSASPALIEQYESAVNGLAA